jgi:hypothetical protein
MDKRGSEKLIFLEMEYEATQKNMSNKELIERIIEESTICYEYGEPGYENTGKPILLLSEAIENGVWDELEKDYELEYTDEWLEDEGKCYRTQPDSWEWTPSWVHTNDHEIITIDTVEDNMEEYLKYLINHHKHTNILKIDLETQGFTLLDKVYCNHWSGDNDDPYEILKNSKYDENIFEVTYIGQWECRFKLWVRNKNNK